MLELCYAVQEGRFSAFLVSSLLNYATIYELSSKGTDIFSELFINHKFQDLSHRVAHDSWEV